MANATTRDCSEGFKLFKSAKGDITLTALNKELRAKGFSKVSSRTFSHYRRLRANGVRKYVPVNKLKELV